MLACLTLSRPTPESPRATVSQLQPSARGCCVRNVPRACLLRVHEQTRSPEKKTETDSMRLMMLAPLAKHHQHHWASVSPFGAPQYPLKSTLFSAPAEPSGWFCRRSVLMMFFGLMAGGPRPGTGVSGSLGPKPSVFEKVAWPAALGTDSCSALTCVKICRCT